MIIVKTEQKPAYRLGGSKKNHYTCPHCDTEILFGSYIRTTCEDCNTNVFNIEKVLDDAADFNKVIYYNTEKI